MNTKFEIIKILKVTLILISIYIVPKFLTLIEHIKKYIEERTTEKQRAELLNFANIGIKIAENYYKEKNKGKDKKDYVIQWLSRTGIKASKEQINTVIDVIVDFYNTQGWDKEISKYLSSSNTNSVGEK